MIKGKVQERLEEITNNFNFYKTCNFIMKSSKKNTKTPNLRELYHQKEVLAILKLWLFYSSQSKEKLESEKFKSFHEQLSNFIKENW